MSSGVKNSSDILRDFIWLNSRYFSDPEQERRSKNRPHAKRFGPLRILELVDRNAVRLDLSAVMKIHPVVHEEHTRMAIE